MHMSKYHVNFNVMRWESPVSGMRFKGIDKGNKRIRLIELTEHFFDKDWCTKGHIGYVLQGRVTFDFDGDSVEYRAGDGIFILKGEMNKHKANVDKGERALMILVEDL